MSGDEGSNGATILHADRSEITPPDAPLSRAEPSNDPDLIRLHAEELSVRRECVETGRLRVNIVTREREEHVGLPLARERVEVERVAIDRPVSVIPPMRQEGDTTIISIVEEVVFVERRLILKEELRVTRVRTTEQHEERVVLRRQEAVVTRIPSENLATDAAPRTGIDGN